MNILNDIIEDYEYKKIHVKERSFKKNTQMQEKKMI